MNIQIPLKIWSRHWRYAVSIPYRTVPYRLVSVWDGIGKTEVRRDGTVRYGMRYQIAIPLYRVVVRENSLLTIISGDIYLISVTYCPRPYISLYTHHSLSFFRLVCIYVLFLFSSAVIHMSSSHSFLIHFFWTYIVIVRRKVNSFLTLSFIVTHLSYPLFTCINIDVFPNKGGHFYRLIKLHFI